MCYVKIFYYVEGEMSMGGVKKKKRRRVLGDNKVLK
jgi:hypothetical protein